MCSNTGEPWASEMAWWVKMAAVGPDSPKLSSDLPTCAESHVLSLPRTQINEIHIFWFIKRIPKENKDVALEPDSGSLRTGDCHLDARRGRGQLSLYWTSIWCLTELSLSWQFSFTYQESLVTIVSFVVEGWAGCNILPGLHDHNPRVADVLAGACLPSALKLRRATYWACPCGGSVFSTLKISYSSSCWKGAAFVVSDTLLGHQRSPSF